MFNTSTTAQCQIFSNILNAFFAQSMLNDSQLYVSGMDIANPYPLYFCKITFGNTAAVWGKVMRWDAASWSMGYSNSVIKFMFI